MVNQRVQRATVMCKCSNLSSPHLHHCGVLACINIQSALCHAQRNGLPNGPKWTKEKVYVLFLAAQHILHFWALCYAAAFPSAKAHWGAIQNEWYHITLMHVTFCAVCYCNTIVWMGPYQKSSPVNWKQIGHYANSNEDADTQWLLWKYCYLSISTYFLWNAPPI